MIKCMYVKHFKIPAKKSTILNLDLNKCVFKHKTKKTASLAMGCHLGRYYLSSNR